MVSGESAVAIINPSGALAVACRGSATRKPAPVRTIAVIPSHDQYVFAVHPRTGLSRFEEIRERRLPLRLSLRGQRDHCLHAMLDDILRAAGFSLADLQSWGGTISYESRTPFFDEPKFGRLIRGELDAVFDDVRVDAVKIGMVAQADRSPAATSRAASWTPSRRVTRTSGTAGRGARSQERRRSRTVSFGRSSGVLGRLRPWSGCPRRDSNPRPAD